MKIIMLDFEGMNNYAPKTRIIQAAALTMDLESGEVISQFNAYINDRPLWTVDSQSTREFWRSQPTWNEMKERIRVHGIGHKKAITLLEEYYRKSPADLVYTCGHYDVGIMESYEYNLGISRGIPFYLYREFRGIREQYKDWLDRDGVPTRGNHFADEDVLVQAQALHHCYKEYGYRPKY